jgi:hypothetical protein
MVQLSILKATDPQFKRTPATSDSNRASTLSWFDSSRYDAPSLQLAYAQASPIPLPSGMVYLQVGDGTRGACAGDADAPNRELMASAFPMGLIQMFVGSSAIAASEASLRGSVPTEDALSFHDKQVSPAKPQWFAGIVASALWMGHVTLKRFRHRQKNTVTESCIVRAKHLNALR